MKARSNRLAKGKASMTKAAAEQSGAPGPSALPSMAQRQAQHRHQAPGTTQLAGSLIARVCWVQRKVVRGEQLRKARVGQVHASEAATLTGCRGGRGRTVCGISDRQQQSRVIGYGSSMERNQRVACVQEHR